MYVLKLEKFLINEFLNETKLPKYNFNIITGENELFIDTTEQLVKEIVKTKFDYDLLKVSKNFTKKMNDKNVYVLFIETSDEFINDLGLESDEYDINITEFINNKLNIDDLIKDRKEKLFELIGMYQYHSIKFLFKERIGLAEDGAIYLSDYGIESLLLDSKFNVKIIKE
jgi:hypothetical protein